MKGVHCRPIQADPRGEVKLLERNPLKAGMEGFAKRWFTGHPGDTRGNDHWVESETVRKSY